MSTPKPSKPRKSTKKTPPESAKKPRRKSPRAPQTPMGRPQSAFTVAIAAKIAETIRTSGISVSAAAELHRVNASTARNWMQALTPEHADLRTEIRGAKRVWEYELARIVRKAAEENPDLALRLLSKRSEDWSDRQIVEVVEPPAPEFDDKPIVEMLRNSAELRRTYAAYLDSLETVRREHDG